VFNFIRNPETGDLSYANCVGLGAGCTALTAGATAYSVTVSPDSRNVYVKTSVGLAILDRTDDLKIAQKPTFAGCLSEGNVANCTDVDGLAGDSFGLDVSPDGNHVYVAFRSPGGVSIFKRAGDGTLAPIVTGPAGGCISANGASGGVGGRCVVGGNSLSESFVTALSPDGRFVYVGGPLGFTSFRRNEASGGLTQTQCFGTGTGCAAVPVGLSYVFDLAVTAAGDELIAAAYNSETVVSFQRDPGSGALSLRPGTRGCISRTGTAAQCLTLSFISNEHYLRLALDPAGRRFYVSGRFGVLATVTRDFAPVCESTTVETTQNTALAIPLNCADANGDAFTLEKAQLPTAGQLGEINAGSVFFNPFGGFLGTDVFTYRARTPSRDVTGPLASIRVNVILPPAPLPNPAGLDNDRDGFFAFQDCNDSNAAIRPGASEIRGNNFDENCDGLAEPFPTLASGVVNKWDVKGSRFTLTTLQVTQQFPKGWKARILCKGKGCPFRSKALKAGKIKRGASTVISALTKKQRRFRAGQTIEIWVSAPNFNTKVARLVLKKGKIPTTEPFCVLPGQTKVQKTCT
jgi:DNA-binding beta-propeller fold protein YncE